MATTRTYYPMADGSILQWTPSTGTAHWNLLDEATPSFTDYVSCATNAYEDFFTCVGSAVTYVGAAMIPWTSWSVVVQAKRDGSGGSSPSLRGLLRYNGTTYAASASQSVTSTGGATYTFTWTTPPWSTTGKTNWGIAPNEIEFGFRMNFISAKTITVASVSLQCVHPDHTPATPTDPDDLRVKTGQDELDAVVGSQNPSINIPVPWDAALNARMQYADMGGCYIEIGTSEGGHEMWQSALLQFDDAYGDEARCPDQRHAGSILQDGILYYWRLKAVTIWSEETGWVSGGTFYGVTDSGTWSSDYHARANIRFGTSHSALPVDYTVPVPFQTGYGVVPFTNGHCNEAIQHSSRHIAYYNGFTYIVWLSDPDKSGAYMNISIAKISADGTVSSESIVDDADSDIDTHYYPTLLVGGDHKLHLWRGGHNAQTKYYRTTNADDPGNGIDITSWTAAASPSGMSASSYPRPAATSDGTIFVFFRHDNGTHYGNWCYVKSTDNGANWSTRRFVVYYSDYIDGPPSMYCGGVMVDSNDRIHIVLSWWDQYGTDGNKGRGISCIYADYNATNHDFETWYEFGTVSSIGSSTDTAGSTNIQYADCTKIAVCTDAASGPLAGPFVHTNSEALVVDGNNYPHFVFYSYSDADRTGEETPIYYVYWSGSAWVTVDLYTDESLPKLWKYRQGGQLYYDDGRIYVYGFVKPTGETYFGGELYCYRRIIDGDTWAGYFLSANTGKGIGMISVMPQRYPGRDRELIFCRAMDIVYMKDIPNALVRYDGADVRIVEAYNNGSSVVRTEIDRLPDAFQLEETLVQFALPTAVSANAHAPTDRVLQVYFGKGSASGAPHDPTQVFIKYDGFEAYASNSNLNGQGGWAVTGDSYGKVFSSFDQANWSSAHTNKLLDGDKSYRVTGALDAVLTMGSDVTDHDISIMCLPGAGIEGYARLMIYNGSTWAAIGFYNDGSSGIVSYYNNGSTNYGSAGVYDVGYWFRLRLTINASGVSGYIDDTKLFGPSDYLTAYDNLRIDCSHTSTNAIFDQLIVKGYVDSAPAVTTNQDDAETFFTGGSSRLSGRIIPAFERSTRLGGKLIGEKTASTREAEKVIPDKIAQARIEGEVIPEVTASTREAEKVIPDKIAQARIEGEVIPEVTASTREAEKVILEAGGTIRLGNGVFVDKTEIAAVVSAVIPDKTSRQRVAELVAAEVSGFDHINHVLIAEATEYERLAADIIVELVRSGRLAAAMIAEAIGTSRLPELMQLEAEVTQRIMNSLQADVTGQSRFDNLTIADKTALARMMSMAILEAVVTGRFAGMAIPDKTERDAVSGMLRPDKTDDAHLMAMVIAEAIAEGHLAAILQPDVTGRSRVRGGIMPEAGHTERAAHLTRADKTALARIIGKMLAEVVGKGRIGNRSQADKLTAARIASTLNVDVTELTRIMHRIVVETAAQFSHVHHAIRPDKIERLRLAERAIAEARAETRLPQLTQAEKVELAKIVGMAIAEIAASGRFRNMAFGDKIALVRLSSALLADKVVRSRVCNIAPLEGILTERFAQFLQAEVRQSTRFAQTIRLQGMTASRIINLLIADKQARARLRNHLIMEDHQVIRLCHGLLAEWRTETRIGGIFRAEVAAFGRLAGQIIVEAADSARVHNLSMPEYDILARLCHLLLLEPSGCGRLSSRVLLEAIIRGLQILRIHLGTPRLINVRVTVPHLKGTYIRQPALTDISIGMPHLKNVRIVSPGIEPITSDANGEPVWVR